MRPRTITMKTDNTFIWKPIKTGFNCFIKDSKISFDFDVKEKAIAFCEKMNGLIQNNYITIYKGTMKTNGKSNIATMLNVVIERTVNGEKSTETKSFANNIKGNKESIKFLEEAQKKHRENSKDNTLIVTITQE